MTILLLFHTVVAYYEPQDQHFSHIPSSGRSEPKSDPSPRIALCFAQHLRYLMAAFTMVADGSCLHCAIW